jgi:hypothetical protein
MRDKEFHPDVLRAALREAERGIRINYGIIFVLAGLQALILGWAIKVANFSDPTHTLIALAVAFLVLHGFFMAEVLTRRQDAMNARTLRALELLDETLTHR